MSNNIHEGHKPAWEPLHSTTFHRVIAMAGNSGCIVKIGMYEGQVVVEKSCTNPHYIPRLKAQISKQKKAHENNKLSYVRIPRILSETSTDTYYQADMEHLIFEDCMEFFSIASKKSIDQVIYLLSNYIKHNLAESQTQELDVEIFLKKLNGISELIQESPFKKDYLKAIQSTIDQIKNQNKFVLPIGTCHGDLTFSNIMIANDQQSIGLIDFLDSYLESPVVDVAKLKQDTQFYWSSLMTDQKIDIARFTQIMNYIDRQLDQNFKENPWYDNELRLIQAVNILRIAPYAKKDEVHNFIINGLKLLRI